MTWPTQARHQALIDDHRDDLRRRRELREQQRRFAELGRAAAAAKVAAARAALIEDVEWLVETGCPDWMIPGRVGAPSPGALARRLDRAGRPDLGARFHRRTAS